MAAVEERAELHKTIWRIANDLRGSVDGWDFKSYVLVFLFYRFISENLTEYVNASEREAILADGGSVDEANAFDYAVLSDEVAESDRAGIIKDKGFFIRPSDLFANVRRRAASDENLNETLAKRSVLLKIPLKAAVPSLICAGYSTMWTSMRQS